VKHSNFRADSLAYEAGFDSSRRPPNREMYDQSHHSAAAAAALLQGWPDSRMEVLCLVLTTTGREPKQLVINMINPLRPENAGCGRSTRAASARFREKIKGIQPDIVHGQGTEREWAMAAALVRFSKRHPLHGIMRQQARRLRFAPGSYLLAGVATGKRLRSIARRSALHIHLPEDCIRRAGQKPGRAKSVAGGFLGRQAAFSKPVRPVLLNVGYVCQRKRAGN